MTACAMAQGALPACSHRFSPKKFTQHQRFTCLILKESLKTDYRGLVEILADCDSLRVAIELEYVPHFTTGQKAADRLLDQTLVAAAAGAALRPALTGRDGLQHDQASFGRNAVGSQLPSSESRPGC